MNELDLLEFHHSVRNETIKCQIYTPWTTLSPFYSVLAADSLKVAEINESHFDTLHFWCYNFGKEKIGAFGFKNRVATKYVFDAKHLVLDQKFIRNKIRIMDIFEIGDLFIPREGFITQYDLDRNWFVWQSSESLILLEKSDRNARCMSTLNGVHQEIIVPWASLALMDHR